MNTTQKYLLSCFYLLIWFSLISAVLICKAYSEDDLLLWKQQATTSHDSLIRISLSISHGNESGLPPSSGVLSFAGKTGSKLTFCSPATNSIALRPQANPSFSCHGCFQFELTDVTASLDYVGLRPCPQSVPGKFHAVYFVSDTPLLAWFHPNRQSRSPLSFDDSNEVLASLGVSHSPGDPFKRKRPPFSGFPGNDLMFDLIYSELYKLRGYSPVGVPEERAPYTLLLRMPNQPPVSIPVQKEQLENLLNHFTNIHMVIQWLMPLVTGQAHLLNNLIELQASLANEEEDLDEQALEAITEQLRIVLDQPAHEFNLTFETIDAIKRLSGAPYGLADKPPENKTIKLQEGADNSVGEQKGGADSPNDASASGLSGGGSAGDGSDQSPPHSDLPPEAALSGQLYPGQLHDACYTAGSQDTLKILARLRNEYPQAFISVISDAQHFHEDQLLSRVIVNDNQVEKLPGRLFSDEEVVLVIDATKFVSAQLAELNELFNDPPTLNGENLSPNVRIVSLVSMKMKQKTGTFNDDKSGSDYWGRISGVHNRVDLAQRQVTDLSEINVRLMKEHLGLPLYQENDNPIVIDFYGVEDWRELLEGRPDADGVGGVIYQPSPLFETNGRPVVLLNAPWDDFNFLLRLLKIIETGSIEVNGRTHSLNGSDLLVQKGKGYFQQLTRSIQLLSEEPKNPIIINRGNFEAWMGRSAFDAQENVISYDAFLEGLKDGRAIMVSSALGAQQWSRLLVRIKATEGTVSLYIHDLEEQPESFQREMETPFSAPPAKLHKSTLNEAKRVSVLGFQDELRSILNLQQVIDESNIKPLELSLSPTLDVYNLLGQMDIASTQDRRFKITQYEFLNALETGRPVVLRNLEQNAAIQQQLESLLLPTPELLVNGRKREFANARIFVMVPEGAMFESPLWERMERHSAESDTASLDNTVLMAIDSEWKFHLEHLHTILAKIKSMGEDPKRRYPGVPPELDSYLLNKLTVTIRNEHSMELQPLKDCWVKAIRTHILEDYLGHPEAYAWLSEQTEQLYEASDLSLNPEALKQFVIDHPDLDRKTVAQYAWRLFRYCKTFIRGFLYRHGTLDPNNFVIDFVTEHLMAVAPELTKNLLRESKHRFKIESIEPLSHSLLPTPFSFQALSQHRQQQLTTLIQNYPAVFIKGEAASGKSYMAEIVTRQLNPRQPPIIMTASPYHDDRDLFGEQKLEAIPFAVSKELLKQFISSPETADAVLDLAVDGYLTLTEDVCHRLQKKLSFSEYQILRQQFSDQRTQWYAGPLQQWIETNPQDDQPVFLIVDEANLLEPGLLNALKLLYSPERKIYDGGHLTGQLTPLHKLIMTGNPESAQGRQTDPFLRQLAVPLYYEPIPQHMLIEGVFSAEVDRLPLLNSEQKQQLIRLFRELWEEGRKQLPSREFTARDLLDVSGLLHLTLDHFMTQNADVVDISHPDLASLVWHCFEHSMGGAYPAGIKHKLHALKLWFTQRNGASPLLLSPLNRSFNQFIDQLSEEQTGQFSFSGDSVRHLAKNLWLQIFRLQSGIGRSHAYYGRRATLIEGHAARGKDKLLQLVLNKMVHEASLPEPIYVQASHANWEDLKDKIQLARKEGRTIVVSEINLIPSHYLEGELNDILSGNVNDQSPGFHLFATVNPLSYSGRKPLSPALSSRFTHYRINNYSPEELHDIVKALFPGHHQKLEPLVNWHLRLIHYLESDGQLLLPTNRELLSLARYVANSGASVETTTAFQNLYRFYIDHDKSFSMDAIKVNRLPPQPLPLVSDQQWKMLYQKNPLMPPVTFKAQSGELYDNASREFVLSPTIFSENRVIATAEKLFMETSWKQNGLPLEPPDEHDLLLAALYHRWQEKFYRHHFHSAAESAQWLSDLLSEEEKETLKIPDNQHYVQAADLVIEKNNYKPEVKKYHKLRVLLKQTHYTAKQGVSGMPAANIKYQSEKVVTYSALHGQIARRLTEIAAPMKYTTIFQGIKASHERHEVETQLMDENTLLLVSNDFGSQGYDYVKPAALDLTYRIRKTEKLGAYKVSVHPDQWYPLPGLKQWPNAWLSAISVKHGEDRLPIRVHRDRATGFFLFSPDISQVSMEDVDVTYILETREQGKDSQLQQFRVYLPSDYETTPFREVFESADYKQFTSKLKARDAVQQVKELQKAINEQFVNDVLPSCEDDIENLKAFFSKKPALSFAGAQAFWVRAIELGIPVRLVTGETDLYWCEYSLDGGYTWQTTNLHGAQKGITLEEVAPVYPSLDEATYNVKDLRNLEKVAPTQMSDWLDIVRPNSARYNGLISRIPQFISAHLTENGLFSVNELKALMEKVYNQGGGTKTFIARILNQLSIVDDENIKSGQPTSFVKSIWMFLVVEKKWLSTKEVPFILGSMSEAAIPDESSSLVTQYYNDVLASPLKEGVDFTIDVNRSGELEGVTKASFALVKQWMPKQPLPGLNALLAGHRIQAGYHKKPPGVINVSRLISDRPAFRAAELSPHKREVILPSNLSRLHYSWIDEDILNRYQHLWQSETVSVSSSSFSSSSSQIVVNVFEPYLIKNLRYAFQTYLFNLAGGKEGTLKVIFPEVKLPREDFDPTHDWESDSNTFQMVDIPIKPHPNTLLKAGYLRPKNVEQMIALSGDYYRFESLTPPTLWLKQIYNQQDLLLLKRELLSGVMKEFFEHIDMSSLIRSLLESDEYKNFKARKASEHAQNW